MLLEVKIILNSTIAYPNKTLSCCPFYSYHYAWCWSRISNTHDDDDDDDDDDDVSCLGKPFDGLIIFKSFQ